jgi:hypothetical protein
MNTMQRGSAVEIPGSGSSRPKMSERIVVWSVHFVSAHMLEAFRITIKENICLFRFPHFLHHSPAGGVPCAGNTYTRLVWRRIFI